MKHYVTCRKVNVCKDFPKKCGPLCNDFQGYLCTSVDDKVDVDTQREIDHDILLENSRKYEDIIEDVCTNQN